METLKVEITQAILTTSQGALTLLLSITGFEHPVEVKEDKIPAVLMAVFGGYLIGPDSTARTTRQIMAHPAEVRLVEGHVVGIGNGAEAWVDLVEGEMTRRDLALRHLFEMDVEVVGLSGDELEVAAKDHGWCN